MLICRCGLAIETIKKVINFYGSDEVSRLYPREKENGRMTVRENGSKVKVQKRLLLCNIKEIYSKFKSKSPEVKIVFFYFLSPKTKVVYNCWS